jgi:hypothetical protein
LIGDSIMQGAAPMMHDLLGSDIYIDAARKRKMEDVPALVATLARNDHLARVVVIHLGSNRPFEAPVFDAVMESLLAHGVERVMFVNVHRPIGWEYYINKKFSEGVERWPGAELIDWDAMAHTEQGWFVEDQTHLSYAGSEAYVNAIQEKLEAGTLAESDYWVGVAVGVAVGAAAVAVCAAAVCATAVWTPACTAVCCAATAAVCCPAAVCVICTTTVPATAVSTRLGVFVGSGFFFTVIETGRDAPNGVPP